MEDVHDTGERRRVRSLFISDLHLGSRFAQAEAFLTFLEAYQPEYLYIVGDFVDGWSLQRSWRWSPVNTRIVQHLLAWAWAGVTIRYAPGNHDEFLRSFFRDFIWFEVADEFIHESADGRRFVVIHGDQFDDVEANAAWLSKLGSLGYDLLLAVDRFLNDSLQRLDRRCVIYGASPEACRGCVEAKPLSPGFVRDLARCSCIISTAGHQLISEALCLGKPVLAVPEPGQYEQSINALYLERMGGGRRCHWKALSAERVREFVDSATPRPPRPTGGAAEVAKLIRAELVASPASPRWPPSQEVLA